jgi:hypothetical protein
MTLILPVFKDVTTINYTLEWPHLENPSNTTFAGSTQIDICRCGQKSTGAGHIYNRYRCSRPKVRFVDPDDGLWVLQAPLGQVNLLRPANDEEIQRQREVHHTADAIAYVGKNFLLLTGPCPRGRYQAFATLQYLRSLTLAARQKIEYLSLLIQPYEEDCSDDQSGQAYVELARYILEEVPAFKSLYLNIWGEETRMQAREFAMLLFREGVTIVINWDWWGECAEEYADIVTFLKGVETGVVVKRPVWEDDGGGVSVSQETTEGDGSDQGVDLTRLETPSNALHPSSEPLLNRDEKAHVTWNEVSQDDDDHASATDAAETSDEEEEYHDNTGDGGINLLGQPIDSEGDTSTPTCEPASSEDEWSDAMMTPITPHGGTGVEDGGWQIL